MQSKPSASDPSAETTAEQAFRSAFERLKQRKPVLLQSGAAVSQNNVAKEAGRDPSALRKSRYPVLIQEIQEWVARFTAPKAVNVSARRQRLRTARKERESKLILQRDNLASLLVEADAKIVELTLEIARLKAAQKK